MPGAPAAQPPHEVRGILTSLLKPYAKKRLIMNQSTHLLKSFSSLRVRKQTTAAGRHINNEGLIEFHGTIPQTMHQVEYWCPFLMLVPLGYPVEYPVVTIPLPSGFLRAKDHPFVASNGEVQLDRLDLWVKSVRNYTNTLELLTVTICSMISTHPPLYQGSSPKDKPSSSRSVFSSSVSGEGAKSYRLNLAAAADSLGPVATKLSGAFDSAVGRVRGQGPTSASASSSASARTRTLTHFSQGSDPNTGNTAPLGGSGAASGSREPAPSPPPVSVQPPLVRKSSSRKPLASAITGEQATAQLVSKLSARLSELNRESRTARTELERDCATMEARSVKLTEGLRAVLAARVQAQDRSDLVQRHYDAHSSWLRQHRAPAQQAQTLLSDHPGRRTPGDALQLLELLVTFKTPENTQHVHLYARDLALADTLFAVADAYERLAPTGAGSLVPQAAPADPAEASGSALDTYLRGIRFLAREQCTVRTHLLRIVANRIDSGTSAQQATVAPVRPRQRESSSAARQRDEQAAASLPGQSSGDYFGMVWVGSPGPIADRAQHSQRTKAAPSAAKAGSSGAPSPLSVAQKTPAGYSDPAQVDLWFRSAAPVPPQSSQLTSAIPAVPKIQHELQYAAPPSSHKNRGKASVRDGTRAPVSS